MVLDFPQYKLHQEMLANPHWALQLANGSRCYMDGDSGPAHPRAPPSHGERHGISRDEHGQLGWPTYVPPPLLLLLLPLLLPLLLLPPLLLLLLPRKI